MNVMNPYRFVIGFLLSAILTGCSRGAPPVADGTQSKRDPSPQVSPVDAPIAKGPVDFAICYNPDAPIRELEKYDLCIVDSELKTATVRAFLKKAKVLGYLSLGKVHGARPFLKTIEGLKIGLEKDAAFPDSFRVDAADPKWQTFVVHTLIPEMIKTGFNGVFLDDLDDLFRRKLVANAVALIAEIRKVHPKLYLMGNRGLEFLPAYAPSVNAVLLESCFAENGAIRKAGDHAWAMAKLKAGQAANPKLVGFALDYFAKESVATPDATQTALIAAIRKLHATNGLRSCVSTQDLQSMPPK
jgi:polysaccharide biosynthesis protein PelA